MDTLTYVSRDTMTDIANAIRGKNGTEDTYKPSEMAEAISAITTSSGTIGTIDKSAVNFIDYDGTVLYAYTLEEVQALTELPELPEHDGLICQGWNWTLEDLQALGRENTVGAMYITDDGATRLHIWVATTGRMTVPLYFAQDVANGVTIDWGDGSDTESLDDTGAVNTSHTYADTGYYTISLSPEDDCDLCFGNKSNASNSTYTVFGYNDYYGCLNSIYCNMLQSVELGENITQISAYAFYCCYSLASITIPESIVDIWDYAFYCCGSLTSITFPPACFIDDIRGYSFYSCTGMESVSFPKMDWYRDLRGNAFFYLPAITSITFPDEIAGFSSYAVAVCYSLTNITIPQYVTSISDGAFSYNYGMKEYHLKPTTPPTLGSTYVFYGIPDDCIIYVPQGCLEAYQSATNWATYADYMQEESE